MAPAPNATVPMVVCARPLKWMIRASIGNAVMHVVDHEYASGARGVPLLQHSINSIQDEMDIIELEKLAVKDNADVTRVIKKTGGFAASPPVTAGEFLRQRLAEIGLL